VIPLRELAYLPKGEMDPHGVDPSRPRAGKLPAPAPTAPATEETQP